LRQVPKIGWPFIFWPLPCFCYAKSPPTTNSKQALSIIFLMYGFNVRTLKTHWETIEQMRQNKKPAWLAYAAVLALAYFYVALVVVLMR